MTKLTLTFGPAQKPVELGEIVYLAKNTPMRLDSGAEIRDFPIAYQTYGQLNADKSNAILLCHGLTADQYVIGPHPVTDKPGWWELMVGPGKPIDTEKYFVIASNCLGGCVGSFGPKNINPDTKRSWNLGFPVITIHDMVRAQALLIEHLGITKLLSVIGASMGGMQALAWAIDYPERVRSVMPIACAARHTAQNIAYHEIGRQAIMADPEWREGNYLDEGKFPAKGLAVARMTAHVTYLSEEKLARKFGRQLQDREKPSYGFEADFQIESYLRYQGSTFVERFDPNSYLYITRAMDYFDLTAGQPGESDGERLAHAFKGAKASFCLISFSSDWLFPPAEHKLMVHALNAAAANVSYVVIKTNRGHDAFLLDEPELSATVRGFLGGLNRA